MARTKKAAVILLGAGIVAALLMMGAGGKAHAKEPEEPDDLDPDPEPEDPDATDDDVSIIDEDSGAEIKMTATEAEKQAAAPDGTPGEQGSMPPPPPPGEMGSGTTTTPDSSALDKKLQQAAEETGQTTAEAADKLATEITGGAEVAPIAAEETSPTMDPNGTIALGRLLLSRENLPGWKDDLQDEVMEWQSGVGLLPDGKFGIKSAAKMAAEVGILPLVRFWPKNQPLPTSLNEYRRAMAVVISDLQKQLPDSKAQITGLEESVDREEGAAYGQNPGPQETLEFVQDVNEITGADEEKAAVEELKE